MAIFNSYVKLPEGNSILVLNIRMFGASIMLNYVKLMSKSQLSIHVHG
jgi:hypothetical protein